jgi:hypothetical protein
MQKITLVFGLVFIAFGIYAQPPQLIPYQAIARDNSGNPVLNQNIGLRFSIHDQTISGTVVWQESQTVVSNNLGIIVTALGGTTQLTSVDWGSGAKFLQVEMDIAGGTNYLDMGTQQMMSVPYALYAETSGSVINNGGSGNGSFMHWIGEYFQGGVICHLWKDFQGIEHGLIVSINDLGYVNQFSLGSLTPQSQSLGLSTLNNDGFYNSQISSGGAYDICNNYSHDGYGDWYWPSFLEFTTLIYNRFVVDNTLKTIPGSDLICAGSNVNYSARRWYTSENEGVGLNSYGDLAGPPSGGAFFMYIRAFRKF